MKPISLREFILFLGRQTTATFQGPEVGRFLQEHLVDIDELAPFVRFRQDTYARNLIHRTEFYELFALAWLPGQRAAIHDHAGQRCWMTVASGELTLQNYEPVVSLNSVPVPIGDATQYGFGHPVYIDDSIGLHSIWSSARTPTVSMHLYAGPIEQCLVYSEMERKFKQVELTCFPALEAEWSTERPALLG